MLRMIADRKRLDERIPLPPYAQGTLKLNLREGKGGKIGQIDES
jgi:hypothetical protein